MGIMTLSLSKYQGFMALKAYFVVVPENLQQIDSLPSEFPSSIQTVVVPTDIYCGLQDYTKRILERANVHMTHCCVS